MAVWTLIVFVAVLLPFVLAGLILQKIDRAAAEFNRPKEFFLVDLFSLMFLIPLPLAFRHEYEDESLLIGRYIVLPFMILIWWKTIQAVSAAGIVQTKHRFWIAFWVIPVTFLGSFGMSGLLILMLYDVPQRNIWCVAAAGLLAAFWVANYSTVRILRASKMLNIPQDEVDIFFGDDPKIGQTKI